MRDVQLFSSGPWWTSASTPWIRQRASRNTRSSWRSWWRLWQKDERKEQTVSLLLVIWILSWGSHARTTRWKRSIGRNVGLVWRQTLLFSRNLCCWIPWPISVARRCRHGWAVAARGTKLLHIWPWAKLRYHRSWTIFRDPRMCTGTSYIHNGVNLCSIRDHHHLLHNHQRRRRASSKNKEETWLGRMETSPRERRNQV